MNRLEPTTLLDYLNRATEYFRERKIDSPRLNAERLLCGVLGCRRIDLYLQFDRPLSSEEVGRYREMIRRRGRGEPLQHILGTTEFHGREFIVTPDALIPRPETETLVEKVLLRMERMEKPLVADIGTGSGCIAVTIAAERPDARVIATDISEKALALGRKNAEGLGVADRVEFLAGDLIAPLGERRVNLIVSNLPYVSCGDRDTLSPEVRDWEPEVALFAGDDGLSLISRFVATAPNAVLPDGFVAMEIGLGQAERVVALWHTFAPDWAITVEKDLAGVERIVIATRPGTRDTGHA